MISLNYLILCERFLAADDGKNSIISIFTKFTAVGVPVLQPLATIVANFSGTPGDYNVQLELVNIIDGQVIATAKNTSTIPPDGNNNFVVNFSNLILPKFGKYWIKIVIDGVAEPLTSANKHYVELVKVAA